MRADAWDCPEEGCDVVFTEREGGHLAIMEHVVAVHIRGGRDTTSPGFGAGASEPAPRQEDLIEKAADAICDAYERYAPVPSVLRSEAPNIARALRDLGLLADPAQTKLEAERDALLPRLAELAEASGKHRSAEWLRTCALLPVEEWPPAPAYKGPMVPAAERDERQARIEAGLAKLKAADNLTADWQPSLEEWAKAVSLIIHARAALAGDQPATEQPTEADFRDALTDAIERANRSVDMGNLDRAMHGIPPLPLFPAPPRAVGVRDDTSEETL